VQPAYDESFVNRIAAHYLRYASLGFSTMPVLAGTTAPRKDWKRPALDSWKALQEQRVGDDILEQWAAQAPTGGIAIVCGRISNAVVIDDDRIGKLSSPQADAFIEALRNIPTATARAKKGRHFYFRPPLGTDGKPAALPGVKLFGDLVELRGEGNYVLAPPSPHPDGVTYVWEREPEEGIAPLPDFVLDRIRVVVAGSFPGGTTVPWAEPRWKQARHGVPEGSRDDDATSYLGRMLKLYPQNRWNEELWPVFVEWNRLNTPPLALEDIKRIWTSITTRDRGKQKPEYASSLLTPRELVDVNPIAASALDRLDLPVPGFAIRGFILDGTTQLFGKPKTGKSFLTLQCALAVASGKPLFPSSISMYAYADHPQGFDSQEGDVLYLALEDSPRRLQGRIRSLWGAGEKPDKLTVATQWWTCYDGGLEGIENWYKSVPKPRFIGIDTVVAFMGEPQSKGSVFRAEYRMFRPILDLATRLQVPIVMVDHASKGKGKSGSSDPFDGGAGTLGTQACVDTVMYLAHDDKLPRARLHFKSRDMEDGFFDIEHDSKSPCWRIALPKPQEDEKSEKAKYSKVVSIRT
jgi:hypothetical protein